MTRKRYAGILRSNLIHIMNTTSTIPAREIKRINKVIYKTDFKLPDSLRKEGYKNLYEKLDKAYHLRVISGDA